MAVLGPTGSGKSALALRLAEEFGGEIVNCDSLQVYRYLDIGTAKPAQAERRCIPHHLYDLVDPDQVFTAGEYARVAREALREIAGRARLPVIAGGTGFYLRALLEGLFGGPERDERLRARLARREAHSPGWLHRFLEAADPAAAARIHARDVQKLVRAAEVVLLTRRPLTESFARGRDRLEGFRTLKLGLDPPRAALYARLDARCERMFASGLLDEVRAVLARGFPPSSKALEAHGYRQAVQVLSGEIGLAEALSSAQRNTRRYAKRQWTWFRREAGAVWLRGFGDEPRIGACAAERMREFLECAAES